MNVLIRCLLYLYPSDFRARFADEIGAFLTIRREELAGKGQLRCSWLAAAAVDISRTALVERVRALRPVSRSLFFLPFLGVGLIPAVVLLTATFVAFEQLVRDPLSAIHHVDRTASQALVFPAALGLVIVGLAHVLRDLRKPDCTRRQTSDGNESAGAPQ